jgi:hypothetical protein
MTQEALKIALDALETELSIDWTNNDEFNASAEKMYKAIAVIKEALAQPEQEPNGHFLDFAYSDSIAYVHVYDQFRKGQQFYKAPPQGTWVGLTDEEIEILFQTAAGADEEVHIRFARAIESKIKEVNT